MLVKIYADCNHEFRVGSGCGLVQIRDRISIPEGCYGVFFVRKSLAVKGLSSPHCIFHSQWEGVPTIALMFNGVNIVEIRAGDEIGELLIQPILAVKGMDLSSFQNIRREKTFGQLMEKGEELEAERKARINRICEETQVMECMQKSSERKVVTINFDPDLETPADFKTTIDEVQRIVGPNISVRVVPVKYVYPVTPVEDVMEIANTTGQYKPSKQLLQEIANRPPIKDPIFLSREFDPNWQAMRALSGEEDKHDPIKIHVLFDPDDVEAVVRSKDLAEALSKHHHLPVESFPLRKQYLVNLDDIDPEDQEKLKKMVEETKNRMRESQERKKINEAIANSPEIKKACEEVIGACNKLLEFSKKESPKGYIEGKNESSPHAIAEGDKLDFGKAAIVTDSKALTAVGDMIRQYHAKGLTIANTPKNGTLLFGEDLPKRVKEWYDNTCVNVFNDSLHGSSSETLIPQLIHCLMEYADGVMVFDEGYVEKLQLLLDDLANIRYNQLHHGGLNMKEAMILNGIIDVLKLILFIEERPTNGK